MAGMSSSASFDPLGSASRLIVYVDFKSPYAYLAKDPTFQLADDLGIDVDWRPLTLDIPSYLGSARKSGGKVVESNRTPASWRAVKYAYRDARRYAERQGYILKGTEKIWDSSISNIGILWVIRRDRRKLPAYFEAVYPAFWRRELDVEDVAVVEACIRAAGVDPLGFAAWSQEEGRELHDGLQAQLHPAGIYGVPTYVFEREILFGREHLPYIRWALSGRVGAAPDIAYSL